MNEFRKDLGGNIPYSMQAFEDLMKIGNVLREKDVENLENWRKRKGSTGGNTLWPHVVFKSFQGDVARPQTLREQRVSLNLPTIGADSATLICADFPVHDDPDSRLKIEREGFPFVRVALNLFEDGSPFVAEADMDENGGVNDYDVYFSAEMPPFIAQRHSGGDEINEDLRQMIGAMPNKFYLTDEESEAIVNLVAQGEMDDGLSD